MPDLNIKLNVETDNCWCVLCSERMLSRPGPELALAVTEEPVCRDCGKKHAPELVALLDLAHVAERIGRMCGHILVPSMEALLSLARAAEDYSQARPRLVKKAG